jgi:hypothetical protein
MAEARQTVAAIMPLLELSGIILATGYGFLTRVSNVPYWIRELLTEVSRMNCSLGHLESLLDANAPPKEVPHSLRESDILDSCHELLSIAKQVIETCESVDAKDIGPDGRATVWPVKEKEMGDVLTELSRLRRYLATAENGESM